MNGDYSDLLFLFGLASTSSDDSAETVAVGTISNS
jgi:hypothetical protein